MKINIKIKKAMNAQNNTMRQRERLGSIKINVGTKSKRTITRDRTVQMNMNVKMD